MIIKKMFKILIFSILINLLTSFNALANEDFKLWIKNFKIKAIDSGISRELVDQIMSEAVFIPTHG